MKHFVIFLLAILSFTACKKDDPNAGEECSKKSTGKITIENKYSSNISLNIDGTDFGTITSNTSVSHNLSAGLKTIIFESVGVPTTDPSYFSTAKSVDLQQCSETSMSFSDPNTTTTTTNNNNTTNDNPNIVSDCEQKNVGALTIENSYDISLTLKIDGADFGPILKKSTVSFSVSAGFRTITLEPVGTTVSDPNYFKKSQTVDLQRCTETKLTYTDPCDGVTCPNGGACFEGVCNPYHSDQVCVDLLVGIWTSDESASKTWKNGVLYDPTTEPGYVPPSGTSTNTLNFNQYTINSSNSESTVTSTSTYTPTGGTSTTTSSTIDYKVQNNCAELVLSAPGWSSTYDIISLTATEFIIEFEATADQNGDIFKYRSAFKR